MIWRTTTAPLSGATCATTAPGSPLSIAWPVRVSARDQKEAIIRIRAVFGRDSDEIELKLPILNPGTHRSALVEADVVCTITSAVEPLFDGEWLAPGPLGGDDAYSYRLTGNSLQAAARQGITARHITAFLRRACERVPQHLIEAVERWGRNGVEARASSMLVLRLSSPDLLDLLRRSPQASRYLGEQLGNTAIEVKNWEKLREAMIELGLAAEFSTVA